jgi:hypothetical protein
MESNKSRDFWIEQEFLADVVRNALKTSDVRVAPLLDFREDVAKLDTDPKYEDIYSLYSMT